MDRQTHRWMGARRLRGTSQRRQDSMSSKNVSSETLETEVWLLWCEAHVLYVSTRMACEMGNKRRSDCVLSKPCRKLSGQNRSWRTTAFINYTFSLLSGLQPSDKLIVCTQSVQTIHTRYSALYLHTFVVNFVWSFAFAPFWKFGAPMKRATCQPLWFSTAR